jgi:hypothetical protein
MIHDSLTVEILGWRLNWGMALYVSKTVGRYPKTCVGVCALRYIVHKEAMVLLSLGSVGT